MLAGRVVWSSGMVLAGSLQSSVAEGAENFRRRALRLDDLLSLCVMPVGNQVCR